MQPLTLDYLQLSLKIKLGSIAIFPTDTLPALGVIPKFSNKIWQIKKRPLTKPLILMSSSKEALFEFVLPSAIEDAYEMADKYWPGPLTMVLPASGKEVSLLNQSTNTIGIRVPGNNEALELLSETGPLATTSANISGEKPIMNAEEAFYNFPDVPLLGPLPWPKFSGIASSVIFWNGSKDWKFLRRGAVIPFSNKNK